MPSYQSPAVYVEEVSGGVKPIAGVGTSTGAFVGIAEKGVVDKAILVTNWSQFVREFGGFTASGYLAYSVFGFFAEGGTSCYVVRAAASGSQPAAASKTFKNADATADAITVTARSVGADGDRSGGSWGNKISIQIDDPSEVANKSTKFKLTVLYNGQKVEEYDNIDASTMSTLNAAIADINKTSLYVALSVQTAARPGNGPASGEGVLLAGGGDGTIAIASVDFIGDAVNKRGLHAFDAVDDINIVAIPDQAGDRTSILAALNYCKNRKDCFFIADPPGTAAITPVKVLAFKEGKGDYAGSNPFNSSFGALYYPWVYVSDPLSNAKKAVPPSGVVAGTYAYTDSTRGVHKAPAGTSDGYLDSVIGVEAIITKGEHDQLNPQGINVIRSLPSGICIWGARTLSADSEWTYVNIRRLLLYIEESIDKASQWVVFEPNEPTLWGKVKRNITAFLTRTWRDGALFGATPEEAFFVKVDEENNPEVVRNVGELIIEVGVCPVKPAEFVIIRISQQCLKK